MENSNYLKAISIHKEIMEIDNSLILKMTPQAIGKYIPQLMPESFKLIAVQEFEKYVENMKSLLIERRMELEAQISEL